MVQKLSSALVASATSIDIGAMRLEIELEGTNLTSSTLENIDIGRHKTSCVVKSLTDCLQTHAYEPAYVPKPALSHLLVACTTKVAVLLDAKLCMIAA